MFNASTILNALVVLSVTAMATMMWDVRDKLIDIRAENTYVPKVSIEVYKSDQRQVNAALDEHGNAIVDHTTRIGKLEVGNAR